MKLYVRTWPVASPSATICISHGQGEHSGRYEHVAARLNREGWTVIAPDHRGHGQSPGKRGHVDRWSEYVGDLHEVVLEHSDPALPFAILAQSMGGLIATHYALAHGETLRGLVLLSPMLEVAVRIPPARMLQAHVMSRVYPAYSATTGLNLGGLSREPSVATAYRDDPLTHNHLTARWVTEAWSAMDEVYRRAGEIRVPVLLCFGDDDPITNVARNLAFAERLTGTDHRVSVWPGARHELLNEIERAETIEEIVGWLRPRLDPS